MALMAAHGEITPMPDCAIFADTQAEPKAVYTWLDWLEKQLPFPVHRVTAGSLKADMFRETIRADNPPFFTAPHGMLRRKCTRFYKLTPIRQKVREITGGKPCVQWIGISTDESDRMKPADVGYITHRWPLIEASMSRTDCLKWFAGHGYAQLPTKSACTFCPYHDNAHWREMRDNDPESFAEAVAVDEVIRHQPWSEEEMYVHRDRVPLSRVDFRSAEEAGQLSMFNDECEGMCGV